MYRPAARLRTNTQHSFCLRVLVIVRVYWVNITSHGARVPVHVILFFRRIQVKRFGACKVSVQHVAPINVLVTLCDGIFPPDKHEMEPVQDTVGQTTV